MHSETIAKQTVIDNYRHLQTIADHYRLPQTITDYYRSSLKILWFLV